MQTVVENRRMIWIPGVANKIRRCFRIEATVFRLEKTEQCCYPRTCSAPGPRPEPFGFPWPSARAVSSCWKVYLVAATSSWGVHSRDHTESQRDRRRIGANECVIGFANDFIDIGMLQCWGSTELPTEFRRSRDQAKVWVRAKFPTKQIPCASRNPERTRESQDSRASRTGVSEGRRGR